MALKCVEDLDLLLRVVHKHKADFVPVCVVIYRINSVNMS